MAAIREDGLVIRDLLGDKLKTFPQGGNHYQFWKNTKPYTLLGVETSFTDQYLLMPKSIFDNWTE